MLFGGVCQVVLGSSRSNDDARLRPCSIFGPSCFVSGLLLLGRAESTPGRRLLGLGTLTGPISNTREDNDASGNNSLDASRGNWWQGIFSYIMIFVTCYNPIFPCLSLFPSNIPHISLFLQVHFIIRIFFPKYEEHQITERFQFCVYLSLFDLF